MVSCFACLSVSCGISLILPAPLYIPPPGIQFRIWGQSSEQVIFSRTHREPEVGIINAADIYSDHWFTLIHGSGAKKGLYAIKSIHTGKVLFSRRSPEPRVGHIDGDGRYNDK